MTGMWPTIDFTWRPWFFSFLKCILCVVPWLHNWKYQFLFWSGFIPVNRIGQIYPTLAAISPTPTFHLARFNTSPFFKATLLLSFSNCIFHVFLSRPRFLFPFTSHAHHPSSTQACTISHHSPLPSEPLKLIIVYKTNVSNIYEQLLRAT